MIFPLLKSKIGGVHTWQAGFRDRSFTFLRRADECKVFSPSASPRAPGPRALHPPAMGGCSAKGPTSIAQRSHENTLH